MYAGPLGYVVASWRVGRGRKARTAPLVGGVPESNAKQESLPSTVTHTK